MATYVKINCGNCGKKIQGWHQDPWHRTTKIGVPFSKCPFCGCVNVNEHIKEYNMLNTFDYINMCLPSIFGSFGCSIILTTIMYGIFQILNFRISNGIIIFIFFLFFGVSLFFMLKKDIEIIKTEIEKSKERLKDKNYNQIILNLINDLNDD